MLIKKSDDFDNLLASVISRQHGYAISDIVFIMSDYLHTSCYT